VRAPAQQLTRQRIRHKAKLADGLLDPLARGRGDTRGVIDRARDSHSRYAGARSHILNRYGGG
jgi:hypothetical protein